MLPFPASELESPAFAPTASSHFHGESTGINHSHFSKKLYSGLSLHPQGCSQSSSYLRVAEKALFSRKGIPGTGEQVGEVILGDIGVSRSLGNHIDFCFQLTLSAKNHMPVVAPSSLCIHWSQERQDFHIVPAGCQAARQVTFPGKGWHGRQDTDHRGIFWTSCHLPPLANQA